jgi:hypothetical protein
MAKERVEHQKANEMRRAVIVNPDRFVEKFTLRDLRGGASQDRAPRRHPLKQAEMCPACLHGHCDTCELGDCTCVHRAQASLAS